MSVLGLIGPGVIGHGSGPRIQPGQRHEGACPGAARDMGAMKHR